MMMLDHVTMTEAVHLLSTALLLSFILHRQCAISTAAGEGRTRSVNGLHSEASSLSANAHNNNADS